MYKPQFTVMMLGTGTTPWVLSANSTGSKGTWFAGGQSYIVRRMSIQNTATTVWSSPAVFSFRTVSGAATSSTGCQKAKITLATGAGYAAESMYYNEQAFFVQAGHRVECNVVTGSSGENFYASLLVEPSPQQLKNLATGNYILVTG